KIKHALLSSQETIALPVQAPESETLSALPEKASAFPLCCVFTLSGVPRPAKSAVCGSVSAKHEIGVKPVCSVWFRVAALRLLLVSLKRLSEFTWPEQCSNRCVSEIV
ncbi:hypothetical protein, partial [Nocardiopsis sp. NPDC058789]|uniref:hypothetical protein n=1 Tax=Nocardiopsis sp. NPDC058789 TaxID=3346634 RepID=UPI00367198CA